MGIVNTLTMQLLAKNGCPGFSTALSAVVITHADLDHVGGIPGVLAQHPAEIIYNGEIERSEIENSLPCYAGMSWAWDGVNFTMLHLRADVPETSSNNRSCVLQITAAGKKLLLTGDIEKSAEAVLVATQKNALPADVLVAPHHGSQTSSTTAFIQAVDPKVVIYTTSYRNKFRFPHVKVQERYRNHGTVAYNTAYDDAIRILFNDQSQPETMIEPYRASYQRYWHHAE